MPAVPRLAVLCHFPALSLPALVERGDEQEQGSWPGCRAKLSLKQGLGDPSCWRQPWAAPLERQLTADLSGRVLWDHGVGGELRVQDAAVCVGVHGEGVQQLPVLQHPRVQQAARLGDQLGDVFCKDEGKTVSRTREAQALMSGSLACTGHQCAILLELPLRRAGCSSALTQNHTPYSDLSTQPIPARSASRPCPEISKPAGPQGRVRM